MLQRRSIRTKLIYALAVLTIIFSCLAFSAICGVLRYRYLAESISQQAIEIPQANHLHLLAQSILQNHNRLTKLSSRPQMLESWQSPLTDASTANSHINLYLTHFDLKFEMYVDEIKNSKDEARLLVNKSRQLQSLAKIGKTRDDLEDLWGKSEMLTTEGQDQFGQLARELVHRTQEHLNETLSAMAAFSDRVSGHYKGWITLTIACMTAALGLVMILWFSFKSLIAKPFRTLLDGSKLVAGGQYGHRIDLGTCDELSELADAMNCMSTRFRDVYEQQTSMNAELDRQVQERTREVIQNEQLASVGFLAAGVAHEINNPLASIAWSAESLQAETEDAIQLSQSSMDEEYRESLTTNLQRIQSEAYRCKGITERLLDFSRLGDLSRSSVDVGELVRDVVGMVGKVGKYKCKQLEVHSDENVTAHVNAQEIRQVVLNLVTNALESVGSEGRVIVDVANQSGYAYVRVRDNGCGMTQEVLKHLFEPFFTRRRDGTGTGLGLSITYRIVSQHHGKLIASSEGENKGSQMELWLPNQPIDEGSVEESQTVAGRTHDARHVA